MNWKFGRRGALAVAAMALTVTSTGCSMNRLAFWRTPQATLQAQRNQRAAAAAQAGTISPVRQAMNQQTKGAFDPATGDRRVQLLTAQLRLDPQNVEARLELGRMYESYDMEDLAREQYLRAVNLDPDSQAALQGLVRIARRRAGDAREVLPLVRAFVDRHAGDAAALNTLGTVLDSTGDYPAAETAYRQGLALRPLAAYLYNNLGLNLCEQGRIAEAIPVFRRALELDPHSEVIRNNLGAALVRGGDQRSALRLFRDGGADLATAHNNLAAILLEQGQLEESRAEILESLNARSFFAPALDNFKLLLEKDRALHALPGSVPARMNIPQDWWQPQPAAPAPENPREKKP